MIEAYDNEAFGHITHLFKAFCHRKEIEVLATAVEKHGSLEWSARKGEI